MKLKKKPRIKIKDLLSETDLYVLENIETKKREKEFLEGMEKIHNLSFRNAKIDLYNTFLPAIQVLDNITEWLNNKLKKIFK